MLVKIQEFKYLGVACNAFGSHIGLVTAESLYYHFPHLFFFTYQLV